MKKHQVLCANCGSHDSRDFSYDSYWEEYTCICCGWVVKDDEKISAPKEIDIAKKKGVKKDYNKETTGSRKSSLAKNKPQMSSIRSIFGRMLHLGPPNVKEMEEKSNVEGLIKALSNTKYADVRWQAANALGKIGDKRAVEPLIDAFADSPEDVRKSAVDALGQIGDERAVNALIAALNDKDQDVRKSTVDALGQIGDERAVNALIAALNDKDEDVRKSVNYALGRIGYDHAAKAVIETLKNMDLKDLDWDVWRSVFSSLERFGWRPEGGREEAIYWITKRRWHSCIGIGEAAIEPLIAALNDKEADVRQSAIVALKNFGSKRIIEPFIEALNDKDAFVRKVAISALGEIGDKRAVEPLGKGLFEWHGSMKQTAVDALGQIGDERAVKPLIAALNDKDEEVRKSIICALGKIGDKRAVEQLVEATLKDEKKIVSDAASTELMRFGNGAVEPLIAALKHNAFEVFRKAAGALGKIGDKRAVEPLIAALKQGKGTEAAASALGKIGDKRAVEPLIEKLKDSGVYVRSSVFLALEKLGWQPDKDWVGAVYYIAKRQWYKCIEIGHPAVEPLVKALEVATEELTDLTQSIQAYESKTYKGNFDFDDWVYIPGQDRMREAYEAIESAREEDIEKVSRLKKELDQAQKTCESISEILEKITQNDFGNDVKRWKKLLEEQH